MYMEDTMWPFEGRYPDYVEAAGSFYAKTLEHEDRDADEPALPHDRSRRSSRRSARTCGGRSR